MKDRRAKLNDQERALMRKLAAGVWSKAELSWLEQHLPDDTPAIVLGDVRHRLQQLDSGGTPV